LFLNGGVRCFRQRGQTGPGLFGYLSGLADKKVGQSPDVPASSFLRLGVKENGILQTEEGLSDAF